MTEEAPDQNPAQLSSTFSPILGDALPHHIHNHLSKHSEATTELNAVVQRERMENALTTFKSHFNNIADARHIEGNQVGPYAFETLETGTQIGAIIKRKNEFDLVEAAKGLCSSEPDTCGGTFINEGPLSTREQGPIDSRYSFVPGNGIALYATLHTESSVHQDHPPVETHDEVLTAILIDPESILVPTAGHDPMNTPDGPYYELFDIISPEDSRFGPIMEVVSRVNQQFGQEQQAQAA